jgi:hypothetical protein
MSGQLATLFSPHPRPSSFATLSTSCSSSLLATACSIHVLHNPRTSSSTFWSFSLPVVLPSPTGYTRPQCSFDLTPLGLAINLRIDALLIVLATGVLRYTFDSPPAPSPLQSNKYPRCTLLVCGSSGKRTGRFNPRYILVPLPTSLLTVS